MSKLRFAFDTIGYPLTSTVTRLLPSDCGFHCRAVSLLRPKRNDVSVIAVIMPAAALGFVAIARCLLANEGEVASA